MNGIELIAAERLRQVEVEGWTPGHDDKLSLGQMADAAACYALRETMREREIWLRPLWNCLWPWELRWWRPTPGNRVRELEKAGALCAAEIDRLLRLKEREG